MYQVSIALYNWYTVELPTDCGGCGLRAMHHYTIIYMIEFTVENDRFQDVYFSVLA